MTRIFTLLLVTGLSLNLLNAQDLTPDYSLSKKTFGYVNSSGKKIIPYRYSNAEPFHDGKAIVSINGRRGIIDTKGVVLLPLEYLDVKYVEGPDPLYFLTDQATNRGVLNKDLQTIIPCRYQGLTIDNHVFIFSDKTENNKPLYGVLDASGKTLAGCVNRELIRFTDGKAIVMTAIDGAYRYGVLNNSGEILVPFEYSQITMQDGLYIAKSPDLRYMTLLRQDGRKLSEDNYDDFLFIKSGWYAVNSGNKWGVISNTGEKSGVEFDKIIPGKRESGIVVENNGRFGLLNSSARLVLPCDFESIPDKPVKGCYILKKGNVIGCIDTLGKTVVPFTLSEAGLKADYSGALQVIAKLLSIDPSNDDVLYLSCLGRYNNAGPEATLEYISQIILPFEKESLYRGPASLQYFRCLAYADLKEFDKAKAARRNIDFGDCNSYWGRSSLYLGNAIYKSGDYLQAASVFKAGNITGECDELERLGVLAQNQADSHGMKQATLELGTSKSENTFVWTPQSNDPYPKGWPYQLKNPEDLLNGHYSQITGLNATSTKAECGCDIMEKEHGVVGIYCFAGYTTGMKNISESTVAFEMRATDFNITRIEKSTNSFKPGYLIYLVSKNTKLVVNFNPDGNTLLFRIDDYELEKTGENLVWRNKFGN